MSAGAGGPVAAATSRGDKPQRITTKTAFPGTPGARYNGIMAGMIDVTVNGSPRELYAETSAEDLVALLQLGTERIAMEINGQIVPRSKYPERQINAGDRIEIVRAVGGG